MIIIIIIMIILFLWKLSTPAFADGLPLEPEWQQVSSNLQDSSILQVYAFIHPLREKQTASFWN